MFGRKARQIANQAIMIAGIRKENREYLSSLVEKNKHIIALNDTIQELTQTAEDLRVKVTRAEGSADAAIQAGGVISGQLHAAQAALAGKDATIAGLTAEVDELKVAKQKLMEELGQARAEIEQLRAKPSATPGRRPQGVPPKVAPPPPPPKATPPLASGGLIKRGGIQWPVDAQLREPDKPALQKLREEIAKVREGDVEVVWELSAQADADEQPNPES